MDHYKIYFAGDLFDHKHLIGNALLANYIENVSSGTYKCLLPQDQEQGFDRRVSIRNQDLKLLMESELALFNFDGPDLDSGTVVEFIVAKQLDIPAVILRTDFRTAGDQSEGGDNWNLMCSNYPRTKTISLNGMSIYQQAKGEDIVAKIDSLYSSLALSVVQSLEEVRNTPPILKCGTLATNLYQWCAKYCAGGMEDLLNDEDWLVDVLDRKRKLGLIK